MEKVIAYYRVSTREQGESGLGIKGQITDVEKFIKDRAYILINSFEEVESGKNNSRPKLREAIAQCQDTGATLLIAKLDRLARNAAFIMNLQDSKVKFIACDMSGANEFTVGIMALVAQNEAKAISDRTKKALAELKKSGKKLGRPPGYSHTEETKLKISRSKTVGAQNYDQTGLRYAVDKRDKGETLQSISDDLNNILEVTTPHGKKFTAQHVAHMLRKATK